MAHLPAPEPRWSRARRALARPSIILVCALAGVLVFAQALGLGFQADDLWHQIYLTRHPRWAAAGVPSPLEIFTFYDGDPARTRFLMEQGVAAWWTDPALRVAFFRPLTALTHLVDHTLFPGSAAFAHAHSLIWYGALVAVVAAFYRRILGATWIAGLAAVFYALDYNHGVIATWVANRNALIAATFGVGAVIAHARGREEGRAGMRLAAAALLGASLFAGEVGVGALAWLAAWVWVMDRGPLRERIRALAPAIVVTLGWVIVYRAGGWGARGSGVYLDPVREPRLFLTGIFEKVPTLVAAELGGPGPDIVLFGPRHQQIGAALFAAALMALGAIALAPIVRADRAARFFALGTALSLVPACATFVSARQLTLPGLGLIGLVAQLGAAVIDRWEGIPRSGARRRVTLFMAYLAFASHLVLAPLVAQAAGRQLWFLEKMIHRWSDPLDERGLAEARLVVVNAPATTFIHYILPRRTIDGRPVPRALLTLGAGTRDIHLARPDAHTLVARQEGGFVREELELLTTHPDRRFAVGQRVSLGDVEIEVRALTADARPRVVAFRFRAPLGDASLRWVRWDGRGLVPFALPAIGDEIDIAAQGLSPF